MLKSVVRSLAALSLAAIWSVCQAKEVVKIDLPPIEPVTLTFRAFDPQHVLVNENAVLSRIAAGLSAKTRWPIRVGQPDTSNSVLDTGGRTQVSSNDHSLKIQYLAVTRYLNGGGDGTVMTMTVKYAIERTPELLKISLTFPDHATSVREGMPFLTRKLWDTTEIVTDYSSLAASLSSVEVELQCEATGELDSKYKPDTVLANLERHLGRPGTGSAPRSQISANGEVAREGVYVYTVRGQRRTVKVTTYPYHDATKVAYSASLPYSLRSDGSSTGDDDGPALSTLLQSIIND